MKIEMPDGRKVMDLSGEVYGHLKVISYVCKTNSGRESVWNCECDCGNTKQIRSSSLRSGKTTSCGCRCLVGKTSDRLPNNEGAINFLIKNCRHGATQRGYSYSLTKELATLLYTSSCYYCGSEPDNKYRSFRYSGIDRLDNTRGYEPDNVVSCCSRCNYAKRTMRLAEFKQWIYNLFDHMNARDIKHAR